SSSQLCKAAVDCQDDIPGLLLRFDVPGRLDHVRQRVAPIDDRPVLPGLDEALEEKAFPGESSVSIALTSCCALAMSPAKIKPIGFFAMRQMILVPSCFKTSSLSVIYALTLWGSTFSGKGCLSRVQMPAETAAFML